MKYNFYECGIASSSARFDLVSKAFRVIFSIDRVDFGRLSDSARQGACSIHAAPSDTTAVKL